MAVGAKGGCHFAGRVEWQAGPASSLKGGAPVGVAAGASDRPALFLQPCGKGVGGETETEAEQAGHAGGLCHSCLTAASSSTGKFRFRREANSAAPASLASAHTAMARTSGEG